MANNSNGIAIKDSQHLETVAGTEKIPVSDGSGRPVHITVNDIKTYFQPDYAPQWTDATVYLTLAAGWESTREIGSAVPTVAAFTASGAAAKAVSAYGTANGGAFTNSMNITTSTTDGVITSATCSLSRAYAAGTGKVRSSKGTLTSKTAINSSTLLEDAYENYSIDATTFCIKAITKTTSLTINYVYALYANTVSIDNVQKLPLTDATTVTFVFPAESLDSKHAFDIPKKYTVSSIKVLNTLSNKYETYDMTNFVKSEVVHKDAGGNDVTYYRYTRNDGTNGATTFQVTFSK